MPSEEHKIRHIELHKSLDELLADYINITGNLPSKTMLSDFLKWSYMQTINPVEK